MTETTKTKTKPTAKPDNSQAFSFLEGGGELANMIRTFDWAQTGLGNIKDWPATLKTTVNIILQSPVPIVVLWGKDGIMIYNDAYSVFAGQRHPSLLGSKVVEGWPEVADFNRNVMRNGLRGKTLSYKDQQLTLYRNNVSEQVWMDLNYSPIMDEHGKPTAVMAIVVETTQRILAEKKQATAEIALKSERERLHDLFMHAPAIISVMRGPDHVYEMANPLYMQVVGQRPVLGKTLREALPELEGQNIYEMYDHAFQTGKPAYGSEVPVRMDKTGDGSLSQCYFNFVYQPYFNDQNEVEGVLVHAVEVTDQVEARKAVEDQNDILNMIARGAPMEDSLSALVVSAESLSEGMIGSILLLDESGEHLRHGAAPHLPKSYIRTIDGMAIGPVAGSCGTAAYTKKTVIVSDISRDPLWRDFKGAASKYGLKACWSTPICAADGRVLGTFAMYYDRPRKPSRQDEYIMEFVCRTAALIIERKQTEDARTESEQRFRFMAETLPLKIFTTNAAGRLTYLNPQWTEYTGAPISQLLKERVLGWIHPDDLDSNMRQWEEALRTGKSVQNQQRLRRHDGQYRRHISYARPMLDKRGKITGWFGSMTDIEDALRTVVEKEKLELVTAGLKEQRAQLVAINKVKDEFVTLSSHQLRTPATAVKQYLAMVRDGFFGEVTNEQRQALQVAYESNERQLNIINDLLKTAQLDASTYRFKKNRQSIASLLEESIEEMQSALALKQQTVQLLGKAHDSELLIDRSEIKLVFTNILENAIKYSFPERAITVTIERAKDCMRVSFEDQGVGIGADDIDRIFDKFSRIDNELSDTVNGSGLGLYWAKRIIKLHRGDIEVSSIVGKGTTFTICLPLSSA